MDMAEREGIRIDVKKLRAELGCVVVPIAARNGNGLDELRFEIERLAGCAVVESAGKLQNELLPLPAPAVRIKNATNGRNPFPQK